MPARKRSREIERLVDELIEAVESAISARARVLTEEFMRAAMAEAPSAMPGHASLKAETAPDATPPPPRARRVRPKPAVITKSEAPPAVDPDEERRTAEREQERRAAGLEEERRTAELARLLAIVRPTVHVPPSPSVIASPPPPAPEEDGSLQALEDHSRDRIPSLPSLSVARYTAQIAACVGGTRPPDPKRPGWCAHPHRFALPSRRESSALFPVSGAPDVVAVAVLPRAFTPAPTRPFADVVAAGPDIVVVAPAVVAADPNVPMALADDLGPRLRRRLVRPPVETGLGQRRREGQCESDGENESTHAGNMCTHCACGKGGRPDGPSAGAARQGLPVPHWPF
jgi:hypothetical protein